MTGPHPAVAATRVAVRGLLSGLPAETSAAPLVLVACSGGTDSLALAAAVAFEAPRRGVRAGAVIVDHGLQPDSAQVAQRAAAHCRDLGLYPVAVVAVQVGEGPGPEAAARRARHTAYEETAHRHGAVAVLLAHTRDDQAEQVLLGLVRGSGTRSLAGMPAQRGLLRRPFLAITREQTVAACIAQSLVPWEDPHNADERFTRVRARRLLASLRAELDPAIAAALARTADLARADADALDAYALAAADRHEHATSPDGRDGGSGAASHDARRHAGAGNGARSWGVADLAGEPAAVRGRVWRIRAARLGLGALSSTQVSALEQLCADRGCGPIALPGGLQAVRSGDRVHIESPRRVE